MSIASSLTTLVSIAGVIAAGLASPPVAVTQRPPSAPTGHGWVWPIEPQPAVVRPFDRPDERWLPGHRGVDLASVAGATVRAPAEGRISFAGEVAGRDVVVVTHGAGLRSTFEPVTAILPEGAPVARGAGVGRLAATPGHCVPATCLHWGVLRGAGYLDPLTLIGRQRVRLLPLG